MEPHTASKLRERKSNRLRDYVSMAGPLGVSHLMLFSRGKESGHVNLRLAVTPRGPTLMFRVERWALCRDVVKSMRKPRSAGKAGGGRGGLEHLTPPLLVMNNFVSGQQGGEGGMGGHVADGKHKAVPKHLESLVTSTFQSLFPPISPQATGLKGIRRVLLLNRETKSSSHEQSTTQQTSSAKQKSGANGAAQNGRAGEDEDESEGAYTLNLRHYAITTKQVHKGLSRGLKRLQRAQQHAKARDRKPQPGAGDAGTAAKGIASNGLSSNGPAGASSKANGARVRKQKGALPDLGRLEDIADYLESGYTSGGYTSASETELDTDAEVEVLEPSARKVINQRERERRRQEGRVRAEARRAEEVRGEEDGGGGGAVEEGVVPEGEQESESEEEAAGDDNEEDGQAGEKPPSGTSHASTSTKPHSAPQTQKRAIHLTELGPRLKLRLLKVEEGLCTGKVMWHELYSKTAAEERKLEATWSQRNVEKEERRRVQRENLEAKRAARGKGGKDTENGREDDEDMDHDDDDDDDDVWDEEEEDEEMMEAG